MSIENGPAPQENELATLREAYLERLTRPGEPFKLADAFPSPPETGALLSQLSLLKECLDSFRPFDPAQIEKLREAFDTEYTYHSNRIEGNTLTLRETDLVINKGLTIAGKPLNEHLEAINHATAVAFIRDLASRREEITAATVNRIHALVVHGILGPASAGVYRQAPTRIAGSQHVPPNWQKVPELIGQMFAFYDAHKDATHPVELAAQVHEKLATIHPYVDGNGRTARLLMNLILLRNSFPITIISSERDERQAYYASLEAANISPTGDNSAFVRFVAENVRTWLLRYLELVADDSSEHAKNKGFVFFKAVAPHLDGRK